MRIAVAGGTGLIGTMVVERLVERDHDAVVIARSAGIDLTTGAGLAEALVGVDAVIDVSNLNTTSAAASVAFFRTATEHLIAAECEAGVGHHVVLSIVGVDRAPYGYYAGKMEQERAVESGRTPWTILRATQFHEFAEMMHRRLSVGGVHLAPRMTLKPVAAREVAARLVELAEGEADGPAIDLGGPQEEQLVSMVRRYARAVGGRGPVLAVTMPGKQFTAMRHGAVLPKRGAAVGRQTFDEWLAARVPDAAPGVSPAR